MYKLINEKLGLESCNIGDLTGYTVNCILKQWGDGVSLSELKIFYLPKRDTITLIRDNKNYNTYRELVEKYLSCGEDEREKVKSEFLNDAREVIEVLDKVIECRKNKKDIFLLKHQPTTEIERVFRYSLMREITNSTEDHYFAMFRAFQYGVMQGKRLERSKKAIRNSSVVRTEV